jgi:hypothetical protein
MNALQRVLAKFPDANETGHNQWTATCPGHPDHNPSLCISMGADGRVLIHDQGGCPIEKVLAAVGLKMSDLFNNPVFVTDAHKPHRNNGNGSHIVAEYDYTDEKGKLLFQVVRRNPKGFSQRRPDVEGGWINDVKSVRRVLFRLVDIPAAIEDGKTICIVEGEKDVLAMEKHEFHATCNPGGVGKWKASYSESLRGADVVIIADKDEPGRKHAQDVAASLNGKAKRVRVIELPDIDGKPVKDAADFFDAGGTSEQLLEIAKAAPDWAPQECNIEPLGDASDEVKAGIREGMLKIMQEHLPQNIKQVRIAQFVEGALSKFGQFYYHQELRDFDSAMFFNSHDKVLSRLRSDAFAAWLSKLLVINRTDLLFRFVMSAVETRALSPEHSTGIIPEKFWAARPGALYLSSGPGQMCKITAERVEFVDNGTDDVLFSAGRTLQPWKLTKPLDPFKVCRIFRDLHAEDEHGPDLLRLWLYSLPTNPKSKPPLCLPGEVGSGKTRLAKAITELYGAPFHALKPDDRKEGDFWASIHQGGILILDNVDTPCKWMADAVANASTDGCSQQRKLYTNDGTVTLRPNACLVVTTANPTMANDSGLADRLVIVRMERRDSYTSDSKLSDEIESSRDACLSHICFTLQKALGDTRKTPGGLNARFPDFACFAVRIGRALDMEQQAIAALKAAEADKASFCLENDSIACALTAYLNQHGRFRGTSANLAEKLLEMDPELGGRQGKLSPKKVTKRLAALWPHLQSALQASKQLDRHDKVLVFTFKARPEGKQNVADREDPPTDSDIPPDCEEDSHSTFNHQDHKTI